MGTEPASPGAAGPVLLSAPQKIAHGVRRDQDQGEGQEELVELGRAVDAAEEEDLDAVRRDPRRSAAASDGGGVERRPGPAEARRSAST